MIGCLIAAGVASGALYSSVGFRHGITEIGGYEKLKASIRYEASDHIANQLRAGMFRYTSAGEWKQQCYGSVSQSDFLSCVADSGNTICNKYAWTAGNDPGHVMEWHAHRPVVCD